MKNVLETGPEVCSTKKQETVFICCVPTINIYTHNPACAGKIMKIGAKIRSWTDFLLAASRSAVDCVCYSVYSFIFMVASLLSAKWKIFAIQNGN